jgi:HipA-like kinase
MNWHVSTIHRRAQSGRARPPMVELVNSTGEIIEAYLKSPELHEKKSLYCLEREWIATRLAQDLGLPCATVVPVAVTPQLFQMASLFRSSNVGETAGEASLAQRLQDGPELLIGSVSLGPGWSEWSQAVTVSKTQLEIASAIYFFDTMTQNWDRVMPNPNLLIKNNTYGMIDHEESFVEAAGTDAERDLTPKPWEDGGVVNDVGEIEEHPLWRGIKRHNNVSFSSIIDRWKSLPEATIRGYASESVFDEWSHHVANKITDYLLEAIENIEAVHMQIEANRCN